MKSNCQEPHSVNCHFWCSGSSFSECKKSYLTDKRNYPYAFEKADQCVTH